MIRFSTLKLFVVLACAVAAESAQAADDVCGRPVSGGAAVVASDALFALQTAVGLSACAPSVCDVDGSGAITTGDAQRILAKAARASLPLHCPGAAAPICGQPLTVADLPSLVDARHALGAAIGGRACEPAACDADADGTLESSDALRIGAAARGEDGSLTCLASGRGREAGDSSPRAVPGQGACTAALTMESCRLRARSNGQRDKLRVVCEVFSPSGFPTGFDPVAEPVTLSLADTDGPCFADGLEPGACRRRELSYVCEGDASSGGLSRVRFRLRARRPGRFRVVLRADDTDLSCLSRLSSPWSLGIGVGDDCGDAGCPVVGARPRCPGSCGNSVVDPGEQCDDAGNSAGCDADCTVAGCGDGTLNPEAGEQCDDGGPSATCDGACMFLGCGDGTVNPFTGEECDDAGESASCDADCTFAECGDATTNATAGELCDDGANSAACDADCTPAVCGDGFTNPAAGEQCDDAGPSATCNADCTSATCGDGVVNGESGEECDDGGESAFCDADCTQAECGDDTVNNTAGEECDNANLDGRTCADFGLLPGQLACTSACTYDTSACGGTPGGFAFLCDLTFRVTTAHLLGSLQYDADYSGVISGSFVGVAGLVDCEKLAGDFAAFNDKELERVLSSAMIAASGFATPADVARCRFETNEGGLAGGDFAITVVDAAEPDFTPASPTVEVSEVDCVPLTTTTTTTTSTTVPGGGAGQYDISFFLDNAVTLGALQFTADYSSAPGGFEGAADSVSCTSPLTAGGAFVVFNDDESAETLNFAAVALTGFTGPTVVADCVFDATSTPVPGDFVINVVDASDPQLNPVPGVTVSISSITPR